MHEMPVPPWRFRHGQRWTIEGSSLLMDFSAIWWDEVGCVKLCVGSLRLIVRECNNVGPDLFELDAKSAASSHDGSRLPVQSDVAA